MTKTDQPPESFEIEIDHESLARYYRRQWGGTCFTLCCLPCVFIGLVSSMGGKNRHFDSVVDVVLSTAMGIGGGVLIGAAIATAIYYLFIRRNAKAEATSLRIRVEGSYLRIVQGTSRRQDRKLHFKAIIDYAFFQDSMMQSCNLEGIRLATQAGGRNSSVEIHGVKDALRVRDMLCEIDREREEL